MNLSQQLETDLGQSMKAGDSVRTGTLRLLRAAIKNEQIKLGHELSDDEILKVLQREAKQRRDSIEAYNNANRPELAASEEAELTIIATYLPQPLSEEELRSLVQEVVSELGNPGPSAMGQVIGVVMSRVGAQAQGGDVAKVVRETLA